jgi:hypothetical protein
LREAHDPNAGLIALTAIICGVVAWFAFKDAIAGVVALIVTALLGATKFGLFIIRGTWLLAILWVVYVFWD